MTIDRPWAYAPDSGHAEGQVLTGYAVAASDGTIGHVDRQVERDGMRHLIVDTGVWVFGKSMLIPAGLVTAIDTEARKVSLACTKDEVKAAPVFRTDSETLEPEYLNRVDAYYRSLPAASAE
ncbi:MULTISPECIES: PRC-barrel domain containing protein [Streptomyces]|jgi:hypothetical protein|uniref:PRC-barrel domain containing protein n=1 Tax=Streptomyces griseoaurantiacus TaxID=68213 RepID=A0ABZ1V944_9ACTN|nr:MULTISPECIES: PRC-barrel domain containing protein [Streptomyces]MDX3363726.1 PRC-barrel domain containing protein [Streptomyces sp. ME02-6978.2a]GHE83515.1 hypothetical protein GCM10018782_65040 [Streptomyces griseoaurantiacus]